MLKRSLIILSLLCLTTINVKAADTEVESENLKRANAIVSNGCLELISGTDNLIMDSGDLIELANEIDILEHKYDNGIRDALRVVGTNITQSNPTFNDLVSGIVHSQDIITEGNTVYIDESGLKTEDTTKISVSVVGAIANDMSVGKAAWVNGQYIEGNGATNKAYYERGILFADNRVNVDSESYKQGILYADSIVNKDSASYKQGIIDADNRVNKDSESYKQGILDADSTINKDSESYKQGIIDADNRVNKNSKSYTDGYNAGIIYADGRANPDSVNYKTGYNAGISYADNRINKSSASYKQGVTDADARVNTNSASYKDGYNKGITFADGRVNTNSASYKDGYNKGITFADGRVNTASASYKKGYNTGVTDADARLNKKSVSYTTGFEDGKAYALAHAKIENDIHYHDSECTKICTGTYGEMWSWNNTLETFYTTRCTTCNNEYTSTDRSETEAYEGSTCGRNLGTICGYSDGQIIGQKIVFTE